MSKARRIRAITVSWCWKEEGDLVESLDMRALRQLYGRVRGIQQALPTGGKTVDVSVGRDLNAVLKKIGDITGEDISDFVLTEDQFLTGSYSGDFCRVAVVFSKVSQIRGYLEYGYQVGDSVIEVGALYKTIGDEELRNRCADILSAPGNFDRPINQATQVLEDRIREKSKVDRSMTGVPLVNHAINSDPNRSILIISDVKEEHEGIAHICRGIMLAFRNPTHHQISDKFSREDALSVVGFVDRLLRMIDGAKRNS